jgi:L-iditol 2-dehydrogenase
VKAAVYQPGGAVLLEERDVPEPGPGERVFVHHHVPCGTCELCRRDRDTLCETFKRTRIHPGGFAERILVPAENAARDLLVIPDGVSDAGATLVEPLACCVRGLRRARVGRETRLLVIGGGAIPADRLVTHRFPLERTEEALAAARSREAVKVIVTSSA